MDGTRSHAEGVHIRLQIYLLYCSEGVTQYPTVLGYMNMILLPGQRTGREWQRESTNNERTGRRFFLQTQIYVFTFHSPRTTNILRDGICFGKQLVKRNLTFRKL
jgi:hypothetical protein